MNSLTYCVKCNKEHHFKDNFIKYAAFTVYLKNYGFSIPFANIYFIVSAYFFPHRRRKMGVNPRQTLKPLIYLYRNKKYKITPPPQT